VSYKAGEDIVAIFVPGSSAFLRSEVLFYPPSFSRLTLYLQERVCRSRVFPFRAFTSFVTRPSRHQVRLPSRLRKSVEPGPWTSRGIVSSRGCSCAAPAHLLMWIKLQRDSSDFARSSPNLLPEGSFPCLSCSPERRLCFVFFCSPFGFPPDVRKPSFSPRLFLSPHVILLLASRFFTRCAFLSPSHALWCRNRPWYNSDIVSVSITLGFCAALEPYRVFFSVF